MNLHEERNMFSTVDSWPLHMPNSGRHWSTHLKTVKSNLKFFQNKRGNLNPPDLKPPVGPLWNPHFFIPRTNSANFIWHLPHWAVPIWLWTGWARSWSWFILRRTISSPKLPEAELALLVGRFRRDLLNFHCFEDTLRSNATSIFLVEPAETRPPRDAHPKWVVLRILLGSHSHRLLFHSQGPRNPLDHQSRELHMQRHLRALLSPDHMLVQPQRRVKASLHCKDLELLEHLSLAKGRISHAEGFHRRLLRWMHDLSRCQHIGVCIHFNSTLPPSKERPLFRGHSNCRRPWR